MALEPANGLSGWLVFTGPFWALGRKYKAHHARGIVDHSGPILAGPAVTTTEPKRRTRLHGAARVGVCGEEAAGDEGEQGMQPRASAGRAGGP